MLGEVKQQRKDVLKEKCQRARGKGEEEACSENELMAFFTFQSLYVLTNTQSSCFDSYGPI